MGILKLCALSVDLDEISSYHEIYGLSAPDGPGARALYDKAIDRLVDFARAYELPLTFFAVGSSLARDESRAKLKHAAGQGHEIANHSFAHNYRMTRLDPAVVAREIESAQTAIVEATGHKPVGYRAPGYTMTDEVFDVLSDLGFVYDSSVFPCPTYFAAKAAALSMLAATGRTSRSMLDTPNVLRAPTRPYRVGRPYWERGTGMLELPVQVTRGTRLPYIGTWVTRAGSTLARALTRMVIGEPLVNLELHGIDALDAKDGLDVLAARALELRMPAGRKLDALGAAVNALRAAGYSFVRLDEAAREFASAS